MRHPKNKTRYKTLDKMAKDPRIEEIWEEGPDGLFASLVDGYNVEGCSSFHGCPDEFRRGSLKDLWEQYKLIAKGPTY